jgi:hypothetical protein
MRGVRGQHLRDRRGELVRGERLLERPVRPEVARVVEAMWTAAGHGDDADIGKFVAQNSDGGEPAVGHHEVRENQIRRLGAEKLQRLEAVDRGDRSVARLEQHLKQLDAQLLIVIDYKNSGHKSSMAPMMHPNQPIMCLVPVRPHDLAKKCTTTAMATAAITRDIAGTLTSLPNLETEPGPQRITPSPQTPEGAR